MFDFNLNLMKFRFITFCRLGIGCSGYVAERESKQDMGVFKNRAKTEIC